MRSRIIFRGRRAVVDVRWAALSCGPEGSANTAQGRCAPTDIVNMYTVKNPLKTNSWYRAYLKDSARLVTVKYLGITTEGVRFTDREQNVYSPQDFYFWKTAG